MTRSGDRRTDADTAALPAEFATKARHADQRFCGTCAGDVGPVARRLAALGPVRGLVFGHWAEGSEHVEALLSGTAHCGSLKHFDAMRARDPSDALGTLVWLLRRRWAWQRGALQRAFSLTVLNMLAAALCGLSRAVLMRPSALLPAAEPHTGSLGGLDTGRM